jgi:hypothetical protein
VNEELCERHQEAVRATLGHSARMISGSKSGYRERYPRHVAVFNANVCLKEGKIWHGDLDLTLDEPKLVELARQLDQIVYVLHEGDGRFENEDKPLLDEAVLSVAPSGHTTFQWRYLERDKEGALRSRPPDPVSRRRWRWRVLKHRPRFWHFWRYEHVRNHDQDWGGRRQENMLLYLGARDRGKTPLLVLGLFHQRSRMVAVEFTWYPAGRETRYAPKPLIEVRPRLRIGRLRLWLTLQIWPGFDYSLYAGYEIKERWW